MNFDQIFPDVREQGETPLKQCQLVMLRMYKIFAYLCDKHGIKYHPIGGTLLGAVRHQGFIPWDDDLDISMTRENYEKFLKLVVPELPDDIFFQNKDTDPDYPVCHSVDAKLRDKYSSMNGDFKTYYPGCHDGIMVDIFVYDRAFFPSKTLIILQNWFFKYIVRSNAVRTRYVKFISKFADLLGLVYAHNFLCYFSSFKFGPNYLTKSELSRLIKVKFEDTEITIPVGYDADLRRQFGDYMQLPPEEKRKGHHSEVLPDPFTPCNHQHILRWEKNKQQAASNIAM